MRRSGKLVSPIKKISTEMRWLLLGAVVILLLTALTLRTPEYRQVSASNPGQITSVPYPADSPTLSPEEFPPNQDQTNGIILASLVLVLIILIGSFLVIRRKNAH